MNTSTNSHSTSPPDQEQVNIVSNRFSNLIWSIEAMQRPPGSQLQTVHEDVANSQAYKTSNTPGAIRPRQIHIDKCNPFSKAGIFHTAHAASPATIKKAKDELAHYEKMQYVQLARSCNRLNSVMKEYCDETFVLSKPPVHSPGIQGLTKHLRERVLMAIDPSSWVSADTACMDTTIDMMVKDNSLGNGSEFQTQRCPQVGGSAEVKSMGLREIMLRHGAQPYGNPKKTELGSITFHDWIADSRTGEWSSHLLAHVELPDVLDGGRITMYEVDVPKPVQSTNVPIGHVATDRWIWFLMALPVINSARLLRHSSKAHLPKLIPLSTVIFAAPLTSTQYRHEAFGAVSFEAQNISVHSLAIEELQSRHKPIILKPIGRKAGPPVCSLESPNMLKTPRHDFDFSTNGIPLFEFSSSEPETCPNRVALLPRVFGPNAVTLGQHYLHAQLRDYDFPAGAEDGKSRSHAIQLDDSESVTTPFGTDKPRTQQADALAGESAFWKAVNMAIEDDIERWQMIRAAMARGRCRVMARVDTEAVSNSATLKRTHSDGLLARSADTLPPPNKKRSSGLAANALRVQDQDAAVLERRALNSPLAFRPSVAM